MFLGRRSRHQEYGSCGGQSLPFKVLLSNLPLAVTSAVAVSIGNKVVTQVAGVVRLSSAHEIHTGDVNQLVVLVVFGVVLEGQEDTSAAPAELVA